MSIKYPYTDFHEMNLDWFLSKFQSLLDDWDGVESDFGDIKDAWLITRHWIEEYFNNLNVQDEIDNKLDDMAGDGSLSALINPVVLGTLPPEVVSSTSEMTDVSKTYILQSDAHVYQWDGTAWWDSGLVFGSSIGNVCTFYGDLASPALLSSCPVQSIYHVAGGYVPSDAPVNVHGTVTTIGDASVKIQEYKTFGYDTTYYRSYSSGTWSNWTQVTGFDSVNYNGTIASPDLLEDAPLQSVLHISSGYIPTDAPANYPGTLITFGDSLQECQIFTTFTYAATYYRSMTSGTWTAWRQIIGDFLQYMGSTNTSLDADKVAAQTYYHIGTPDGTVLNIPENAPGLLFTYGNPSGARYQAFYSFLYGIVYNRYTLTAGDSSWTAWQMRALQFIGAAVNNRNPLTNNDADDALANTIYICTTAGNTANLPTTRQGYLVTIGSRVNAKIQFYIDWASAIMYHRHTSSGTGPWSAWQSLGTSGSNPNATMYCATNSILAGVVYINGAYDRFSAYHNAPYSVIADAINILPNNVVLDYHGGSGIIYYQGGGQNLLTVLKSVDLTGYDVVLTQVSRNDMSNPLGSTSSVAGDGSIAGAVIDLATYLHTNYPQCQLVLVAPAPDDPVITGANTFTGNYSNGKNLGDCETLLAQLADIYHFFMLGWQDINISYDWQNYTDGTDVHFNNEDTYRRIGAYLGGQASAKINF